LNTSNCCSSCPRIPSSYQVVLWKQERFVVLRPLQIEFFRSLLEEYLHPHIDDGSAVVTEYFEKFDVISKAGLFFPVFLQEMDHLGQKVFGNRKSQQIVSEVKALVEFLKTLALRKVGDERTDLNFVQQYCRFAVVIVGKPLKLSQSISPYVRFVRDGLERNMETVYLIGRLDNEKPIKQVCSALSDVYDLVSEKRMSKVLVYGDEKRKIDGFVAVLRSKNRALYASSAEML
ncbi:MAG: hypothetical protein WB558_12290, partial [Terriglobales bacterium]